MSRGQRRVLLMIWSGKWRFIMDCGLQSVDTAYITYVSFAFSIIFKDASYSLSSFQGVGKMKPIQIPCAMVRIAHEMDLEHMLISWTVLHSPRCIHPKAPLE